MAKWLDRVRGGRFDLVAEESTFRREGRKLATLVDAISIVGSAAKCEAICTRVLGEIDQKGFSTGSALDLWLSLSWIARSPGSLAVAATKYGPGTLDAATWALRSALIALSSEARAAIMAVIEPAEVRA